MSKTIDFLAGFLLVIAAFLSLNAAMGYLAILSELEERPVVPILTKEERRILCN